ncbi:MAG: GGDEF domain-containing protein [Gemmatimonadetes bacterium]|nr:GGDEF domain-containing protein [Gemmatimonadota bacterium]
MTGGRIARAAALPARILFPEGLVLGALLALPLFPAALAFLQPRGPQILALIVTAGTVLGWRFARGRLVHGLLVLVAAAAVPLLPDATPARSMATMLVPLAIAVLALLPDRGILTRGGLRRTGALIVLSGAVLLLAELRPAVESDALSSLTFSALGKTLGAPMVAFAAALLALATLAVATRAAPARGAFWATAGVLAAHLGHPGGAPYLMAAAGLVLVVATVEDAYALAYRDALTGLPSRRALDELLERTGRRFVVAMVDVDHFKAFNDRHGHDVGDQVLRMVASRLKRTGGGGRAFRYGGEEFTVVFRGRSMEDVTPHLDALRASIQAAEFVIRSPDRPKKKPRPVLPSRRPLKKLSVTVSIGAATRGDRSSPAAEALKAADAALYRAKDSGRNRVVASG